MKLYSLYRRYNGTRYERICDHSYPFATAATVFANRIMFSNVQLYIRKVAPLGALPIATRSALGIR